MHWKHAGWAFVLILVVAVERAAHRLWSWSVNVRTFVWRRLIDCSCVRPHTSCSSKHR